MKTPDYAAIQAKLPSAPWIVDDERENYLGCLRVRSADGAGLVMCLGGEDVGPYALCTDEDLAEAVRLIPTMVGALALKENVRDAVIRNTLIALGVADIPDNVDFAMVVAEIQKLKEKK